MANVKISDLTAATAAAGANEYEINEAGTSKKVTGNQISAFVKADLLDDTTVNFTGTLQNGGSNVVVDSDIGSTVQGYDADLTAIGALAKTDGNIIVGNGTTWVAESGATARTSLGLGSLATQNSNSVSITGGSVTGITDLTVADGGTGASSITANSVILGNGTSALSGNLVAPGTSGNILTSNGTTWTSTAPSSGGAWTVIAESSTATSYASTQSFTGLGSYKHILLYANIQANGSSSASNVGFRAGNGGYQTTGYMGSTLGWDGNSNIVRGDDTYNTSYQYFHSTAFHPGLFRDSGGSIQVSITNKNYPQFHWFFGEVGDWNYNSITDGGAYNSRGAAYMNYNSTIDRFQLYFVNINCRLNQYLLLGR